MGFMRKIVAVLFSAMVIVGIALVVYTSYGIPASTNIREGTVEIVASFYPLAEFARAVGGDYVNVTTTVPVGIEPHEFEPSPRDVIRAEEAQLFIYNGVGVDPWAERIAPSVAKNGVSVLKSTAEISNNDPHVWLDPILARQQVVEIRDALINIDSAHAEEYEENAAGYIRVLNALDADYKTLKLCELNTIVTSHDAFGYIAARYEFEILPISGFSPDAEPSPRDIAELINLIKAESIPYIFFESLVSPRLAETIARETGAGLLELSPVEGVTEKEQELGENYLTLMSRNLQNLKTALRCRN